MHAQQTKLLKSSSFFPFVVAHWKTQFPWEALKQSWLLNGIRNRSVGRSVCPSVVESVESLQSARRRRQIDDSCSRRRRRRHRDHLETGMDGKRMVGFHLTAFIPASACLLGLLNGSHERSI